MNETERANYLRSLLQNQKRQLDANGNQLVNPGINDNDVYTDTETDYANQVSMQTNFDTGTTRETSGDKGNIYDRVSNTIKTIRNNIQQGIFDFGDSIFDFSINTGMVIGDWLVNNIMGGPRDQEKYNQAKQNLENIRDYDWQAQVIAAQGLIDDSPLRLFDKNYRNKMSNVLSSDKNAREYLDYVNNQSNLLSEAGQNVNKFATGIEQSIGNMLPSIAIGSYLGNGAGEAVKALGKSEKVANFASKAASLAPIFVSSSTSKANEVYKETGEYGKAVASGALSGLVEVGTESIPWPGGNKIFGVMGNDGVTFGTKQFIKNVANQFWQEGAEEAISAIAEPIIDEIWKSGSIKEAIKNPAEFLFGTDSGNWENSVFGQFLAGGVSGGIMSSISSSSNNRELDKLIGKDGRMLVSKGASLGEVLNDYLKEAKGLNETQLEELKQKYNDKIGKAGAEWLEEWGKAKQNMTEEQKKNLAEFLENPAQMLKETDEDYEGFIERTVKNASDIDTARTLALTSNINKVFNTNFQVDFLDDSTINNRQELEKRGYNLTDEQYKELQETGESFVKGNTIVLRESMKNEYNRLIAHEAISHGILDSNQEFRDKLLKEYSSNDSFIKEWQNEFKKNKKAKDIVDLYDLPKELRVINTLNLSKEEYKVRFAKAIETMNSEQMASFTEYILGNTNLFDTLDNITQNKLKTILRRALDSLKGKRQSTIDKARTLLENTLKNIVESRNNVNNEFKLSKSAKQSKKVSPEVEKAQNKYKEEYKKYKKDKAIYEAYQKIRSFDNDIFVYGNRESKLTGKVGSVPVLIKATKYSSVTDLIEKTGLKSGLNVPYLESKNKARERYYELYNKYIRKMGKSKAEAKAASETIDILEQHHKEIIDWIEIAKRRKIVEPIEPKKPEILQPKVEVKAKPKVETKVEQPKVEVKAKEKTKVEKPSENVKNKEKVSKPVETPQEKQEKLVDNKTTKILENELENKTDKETQEEVYKNANEIPFPNKQTLEENYIEWNKASILKMQGAIDIAKHIFSSYESVLLQEYSTKTHTIKMRYEIWDKKNKKYVYEPVNIKAVAGAIFDANFNIDTAVDTVMEVLDNAVYVVKLNKDISATSDLKKTNIIRLKDVAKVNREYIKDIISKMYVAKQVDSKLTKYKERLAQIAVAKQERKQMAKEGTARDKVAEYEAKEREKLEQEIEKLNAQLDEAIENAKVKANALLYETREKAKQLFKDAKKVDRIFDDKTRLDRDYRNVAMTKDNIENHIISMVLTPFRSLKKNSLGNSFITTDDFKNELNNLINLYNEDNFNTTDVDGTELKTSLFVEYNPALKDRLERLYEALPDKQEIKTADGNTEYRNQSMSSECVELISEIYTIIKETKKALDRTDSLRFTARANAKASLDMIRELKNDPFSKFYVGAMKEVASSYAVQRHILNGSLLAKKLTTDMSIAESNSTLYSGNIKNQIRLKVKELKIGQEITKKVKFKAFTSEGNIYTVQNDDLVSLYIQLKTQKNFNEINKSGVAIREKDKYRTLVAKGQAKNALDYLEENLSDDLKKYGEYLKETLNGKIKADYIEWYKSKFFVEPNELDDYWTLFRESETESHVKNLHIGVGLFKSAKSRTNTNSRILLTSATNTVTSYADALGKEMYIMPIYDDVIRTLNSRGQYGNTFKKELIRSIDQKNYDFIINNLNEMAGIKTRQYGEWLRFLQAGFALKNLAFNIGPMAKQYASVWTSNLPILKTTKGFAYRITNGFGSKEFKSELNKLIDEIGSLKYRSGITTSAETNTNIVSKVQQVAEVGMIGISKIDLLAMTTGLSTLMIIGEENGFKIGTKENENYVKEHWEEFRLSQIGRNALATNEISKGRGKFGTISQLIFGIMQGATRAASASFVNKIDIYRRNNKLNKVDIENDLKNARENLSKTESNLEDVRKNLTEVELSLNESGVKQQDYEKNEDYRQATQELKDAENNLISAQAEVNKYETQLAEYKEYETMGGKAIPLNVASGLIAQGLFLTFINELVKHIRGKKDWDDWELFNEQGLVELILNTTISWIPVVNVLVNYFVKDYNIEVASVAILTDILDMFKNGGKLLTKAISGEATKEETTKYLREIGTGLVGFSGFNYQLFTDYVIGGVRIFNPEKAIEMRNIFYGYSETSQMSSFKDYVDANNDTSAVRQLSVLSSLYKVRNMPREVSSKLTSLYKEGYNATPKNYMTSYTVDDTTYNLTNEQISLFRSIYDEANKKVDDLLEITDFKNKTSEDQAKIIKKIYDAYYSYAKAITLKTNADSKLANLLLGTNGNFNISKYASVLNTISKITETKRKTRKELVFEYVNRLRGYSKNEKLLILKLAGYSSSSNNEQLTRYLKSLGMNKKEAQEWLS